MRISDFEQALYMLVGLIIGMIGHGFMHGYVAYKSGDMTAKNAGRLTLDPIAHIDPIGTLLLPGIMFFLMAIGLGSFIFGYAKPVPINPFAFRKRAAIIWVSLAGPLTNLVLGTFFIGIAKIVYEAGNLGSSFIVKLFFTLCSIAYINLLLFVFNLIPIPPLDGSRVVGYFLKGDARRFYQSIEPYGFAIILILFIGFGSFLSPVVGTLGNAILSLFGLPKIFFTG